MLNQKTDPNDELFNTMVQHITTLDDQITDILDIVISHLESIENQNGEMT